MAALGIPIVTDMGNVSVNAEATVLTPSTGKRFVLLRLIVSGDTAGIYTFKDGTGGTTIASVYLTQNALPVTIDLSPVNLTLAGKRSAAKDNVLTCTGPGSSHITGQIISLEE